MGDFWATIRLKVGDFSAAKTSDGNWRKYVIKSVVTSHEVFVKRLIGKGVVAEWLNSEDDELVDSAFLILRSVSSIIPDDVSTVLSGIFKKGSEWDEQIFGCLSWDIVEDSDHMFDLRLRLMTRNFYQEFIDWKKLSLGNPKRSITMLEALVQNESNKNDENNSGRKRGEKLYRHDIEHLLAVARSEPELTWDLLNSCFLKYMRSRDRKIHAWRGEEFDIERSVFSNSHNDGSLSAVMCHLVVEAGKVIAKKDSEDLFRRVNQFDSNSKSFQCVLSIFFCNLPDIYSDKMIRWLLEKRSRFQLGDGYEGPKWNLAANLINAFSKSCNEKLFIELETVLCSYTPDDDEFKRNAKYWLKSSRDGYFFPFWGKPQYFLLPALSSQRTSQKTKDLIRVLSRKFDPFPKNRFYSGDNSRGGLIGSKLEPNIEKISNKAWVKIFNNESIPLNHDHSSWLQVNKDTVHVSSKSSFSGSLGRVAKRDPNRFGELFLTLSCSISPCYISTVLDAMALNKPDVSGNSEDMTGWREADVDLVVKFWNRFRGSRYDMYLALSFCRLMKTRSSEAWPKIMFDDLYDLSINHQDPMKEKLKMYSPGETVETSSVNSLMSTTINSVRGCATEAIGQYLWEKNEIPAHIEKNIKSLLDDDHPSVIISLISVLLPVLNINRGRAIEWFSMACEKDERIPCSDEAVRFFNYTISSADRRLLSIVVRMIESDIDEVSEKGAAMATAYNFFYDGIFEKEIDRFKNGTVNQRTGIAKEAGRFVRKGAVAKKAGELITFYFNDSEKDIRSIAADVFTGDDFLSDADNLLLAHLFVNSEAFAENCSKIISCLNEFKGSLIPFHELILNVCKTIMEPENNDAAYNQSLRYEIKHVVSLLLRLYEQALESDSMVVDQCLDVWDIFFEKNIGMTRELTTEIGA